MLNVQKIKETYKQGMRVRLLRMEDIQPPPIGTEGTVRGVDDIGSVMVAWDNGSSLNGIPGEDEIEIIPRKDNCPPCADRHTEKPIQIFTAYSQEADITFIMEEKGNTIRVAGFYYGEPDDAETKKYYGSLIAEFE